jgi:hypothetical protein
MRSPLLIAAFLCGSLAAQNFLYLPASFAPANQELNRYNDIPLMRANARVQAFYDATEVGANTVAIREIALRYDGPIPPVGAPGPFTIRRLRIQVGATTVAQPGSVFAANLSQTLATVFDQAHSYLPDQGSGNPDPWGGPNGTLSFPLAQPATVTIPPGGMLVLEIVVEGNDNTGLAHALLDVGRALGGPAGGSPTKSGLGCQASQAAGPAEIEGSGSFVPGGAVSLHGKNLGAGSPVATLLGASDTMLGSLALPFLLPGSSCTIYTSSELAFAQASDNNGAILPYATSSFVPVPPMPAFDNARIFAQHVAIVSGQNPPYGLALSDKLTIQLGTLAAPDKRIWTVADPDRSNGGVGRYFQAEAFAVRLRIP